MRHTLEDQRVVVLGGTSGIGLAVALQAQNLGATVEVTGRHAGRLKRASEALHGAETSEFDAYDSRSLSDFLSTHDDPFDHIFVGAGQPLYGRLSDTDTAQARDAIARSAALQFDLAKVAAPRMRAGGSITLMGGTSARSTAPGMSVINATMGLSSALVKGLALEAAPVRINLIAAGFVDTPLSARLLGDDLDARRAELCEHLPIHRVVTADDIAFLATHVMLNTAITGAVIDIDGGQQLVPARGA